MSCIAFVNNEASVLRFYYETSTVSIISEQPSYITKLSWHNIDVNKLSMQWYLNYLQIALKCYELGLFRFLPAIFNYRFYSLTFFSKLRNI